MTKRIEPLTPRETEIVLLLADGYRHYSAACVLNVSIGTLKRHLSNISAKVCANSSVEIVAWYYKTYWVPKEVA